jgi:hypothetical protein
MTIDALRDVLARLTVGGIQWVVVVWIGTVTLSMLIVAAVVLRLPPTYFCDEAKPALRADQPASKLIRRMARNGLGVVLVLAGVLLSVPGVPGQGAMTILVGLLLIDFPGRSRLERALLRRPSVLPALNRLRTRFGKAPLLPPENP